MSKERTEPRYGPAEFGKKIAGCSFTLSAPLPELPSEFAAVNPERFLSSPEGRNALRLLKALLQTKLPPGKLPEGASIRYPGGRKGSLPSHIEASLTGRFRGKGKKVRREQPTCTYSGREVLDWVNNLRKLTGRSGLELFDPETLEGLSLYPPTSKRTLRDNKGRVKKGIQRVAGGLTVAGALAGTASCVPLPQAAVVQEIPREEMQSGIQILEIKPIPAPRPTPDDLGKFVSAIPQQPEKQAVVSPRQEATPTVTTTPTATEVQQGQQGQLRSEKSHLELAGIEGKKLSGIPPSTFPTLYLTFNPIYLNQVAEKLGVTEEEFLNYNKFLLKECDVDSSECPYFSTDPMTLRGNRFFALPKEGVGVDEMRSVDKGDWPFEIIERGTEGRAFSVESNSYSIRAALIGLNMETGNFVVEVGDNNYFEVHQDKFLVDFGFAPDRITDNEFGRGLRWQLEISGQAIGIETYGLDENIAQSVALDIKNYFPLVQKYCELDTNNIERIVYTSGSSGKVEAQFSGISCEQGEEGCRILIQRSGLNDAPAHELCHAGNWVQLENRNWIPVYSRIIDEGIATYVGDLRKAPLRSKDYGHLFGDEEKLEQNNVEELRNEVLLLDLNDEKTLTRYGTLQNYAGWAIWKIDQKAIGKGRPEFLRELISTARELSKSEERRVTGYDLVDLAEKIWPGEGANLINNYHVLFIRAGWE